MKALLPSVAAVALALLFGHSSAPAQATRPADAVADQPKLTVAILDFGASTPGNPELGQQIAEALTATLTGEPGFTLVDRAAMARTMEELQLNAMGLVDPEMAVKIGKLVGARILVTGRAFTLDKQLYVVAKVIGTETSLVEAVMVKGAADADIGALVISLSEKLATRLREAGPKLVAPNQAQADPLPAHQARLAKLKRPTLAVRIAEEHIAGPRPVARIDPAVETEVKLLLTQAGFTVVDGDEKDLNRAGVELLISGEAFSEFAARIGNLVSCSARAEVKVTSRNDGKVILVDRVTTRAADLSESLAGKTALQNAGRAVGLNLLEHFAKTLPPVAGATEKADEPRE